MQRLATVPATLSYPLPDPHQAGAYAGPVACGEVSQRREAYPVEASILRADALALSLTAVMDRLAVPLARSTAAFVREKGWFVFGHARLDDHARERFDRSGVWVRHFGDIGRAIEALPPLADLLTGDDGGRPLGTEAARLVARVATAESLIAWAQLARRVTVRELRVVVQQARAAGSVWPAGRDAASSYPEEALPSASSQAASDGTAAPTDNNALEADPIEADPLQDDPLQDDPLEDGNLVRFLVPLPVAVVFDEALDLYRAVVGKEASVTSFIEALVADAMAGADPPDLDSQLDRVGLNRGESRVITEEALAHSTSYWSHLPESGRTSSSWALGMAGASLERFAQVASRAGHGDEVELDSQIRELLDLQDGVLRRLGALLTGMGDMGAWSRLRYDSVAHYAEQRLGMCRTSARQLVRAARGLKRFPILKQAYESGDIGLEATLQILRILGDRPADAATQRAWVDHGCQITVKRIRDESRALHRQSVREDGATAQAAAAQPMSDAEWHASLRREPGMTRERVARLGRSAAAAVEAAPSARVTTATDVFLRLRLPARLAGDFLAAVESARRRLLRLVEQVAWDQPWPDTGDPLSLPSTPSAPSPPSSNAPGSVLAARAFFVRCRRAPAWVGLLAILEEFVQTWDVEDPARRRPEQEIYSSAGFRCEAPACTGG